MLVGATRPSCWVPVLAFAGYHDLADAVWAMTTILGIGPALWWVVAAAATARVGVDVMAVLALVGTLVVGEYFAGRGGHGDAGERPDTRGACVGTVSPGAAGAARARTTSRAPIRRRASSPLRSSTDVRTGRPPAGSAGRGRAGRRCASSIDVAVARRERAHRRAAAGRARGRATRSAAAWSTPAHRSTCGRRPRRPRAPTPASCGWSRTPRRRARRSCASPTAMPWSSWS